MFATTTPTRPTTITSTIIFHICSHLGSEVRMSRRSATSPCQRPVPTCYSPEGQLRAEGQLQSRRSATSPGYEVRMSHPIAMANARITTPMVSYKRVDVTIEDDFVDGEHLIVSGPSGTCGGFLAGCNTVFIRVDREVPGTGTRHYLLHVVKSWRLEPIFPPVPPRDGRSRSAPPTAGCHA